MSNPTPPIPVDVSAGQPARAVTINDLLAVVRDISDRLAQVESSAGRGGRAPFIVQGYIVSVTTDTPSTCGGTTYVARVRGQGTGGDTSSLTPLNRISNEPSLPITPAAVDDPCWIIRGFDATGTATSEIMVWTERLPAVEC